MEAKGNLDPYIKKPPLFSLKYFFFVVDGNDMSPYENMYYLLSNLGENNY